MNCTFEDNSINGTVRNSFLTFDNYIVELRFAEKLQSIENKNVVGAVCTLSKKLEQNGYLLERIKKFSDHLTKAFYFIPQTIDKELVLAIDNKGIRDNFAVSGIRIEN